MATKKHENECGKGGRCIIKSRGTTRGGISGVRYWCTRCGREDFIPATGKHPRQPGHPVDGFGRHVSGGDPVKFGGDGRQPPEFGQP